MEDKTILTEEEKKEFYKNFTQPDYGWGSEGYGSEFKRGTQMPYKAMQWFQQLLAKKMEEEFYLGYLADGFDRGWEAYCKRYNIEFNPQIMMIEKNKWNDEVNKRRKWDYR